MPRLATKVGIALAMVVSAIYFVDLAIYLSLREHLLTPVFAKLFGSIWTFLPSYIHVNQWLLVAGVVLGWCSTQASLWWFAGWVTRRRSKQTTASDREELSLKNVVVLGFVACIPVALCLSPVITNWQRTVGEIYTAPDRHPIVLTGLFAANHAPHLASSSIEAVQGKAWMLDHAEKKTELMNRYRNLTVRPKKTSDRQLAPGSIEGAPETLPDVLVVISECLRKDSISAKTTPNLHRWAQNGMTLNQHYTTGNASSYSFFGIMLGLEADLFRDSEEIPVGMVSLLKQAGYRTGFFGWDDFGNFGMEPFCNAERFDVSEFIPPDFSTGTDKKAVGFAADFLDRKGKYAEQPDSPRFAIVYIFAPHESYCEEQDKIHSVQDIAGVVEEGMLGRPSKTDPDAFVRFLDSVHFADRVIEPLYDPQRIVFVPGDHGESYGEDGRLTHGTALSRVQLNVACIGSGPGISNVAIDQPTSHVDLLPTILDAIDQEVVEAEVLQDSGGRILAGASLLKPIPDDRIIGCRALSQSRTLFIPNSRKVGDAVLGYQGFFLWNNYTLAPGAFVNVIGDRIGDDGVLDSWQNADLQIEWLKQRFGSDVNSLNDDPLPKLHRTIHDNDPNVQIATISLIRSMGEFVGEFESDLQVCLTSSNAGVRSAAFELLHQLSRR